MSLPVAHFEKYPAGRPLKNTGVNFFFKSCQGVNKRRKVENLR